MNRRLRQEIRHQKMVNFKGTLVLEFPEEKANAK